MATATTDSDENSSSGQPPPLGLGSSSTMSTVHIGTWTLCFSRQKPPAAAPQCFAATSGTKTTFISKPDCKDTLFQLQLQHPFSLFCLLLYRPGTACCLPPLSPAMYILVLYHIATVLYPYYITLLLCVQVRSAVCHHYLLDPWHQCVLPHSSPAWRGGPIRILQKGEQQPAATPAQVHCCCTLYQGLIATLHSQRASEGGTALVLVSLHVRSSVTSG